MILLHFNNMRMVQINDGIFSICLYMLQFTWPSLQNLTCQITKKYFIRPISYSVTCNEPAKCLLSHSVQAPFKRTDMKVIFNFHRIQKTI